MVCITDLWKAHGQPSSRRPDKWFKSSAMQEKLESFQSLLGEGIQRNQRGQIVRVPGVLDVIRGGKLMQGTFASYDLALDYTELLSPQTHKWFSSLLSGKYGDDGFGADSSSSDVFLDLPINFDGANGKVRFTPDGRVSVYDVIGYVTGNSNPWQVWNRLSEEHSEVLTKCEDFQFPGKGQKLTPVATLQVFLEILVLLPGRIAASVRESAIRTLIRYMNGDPTLVDEILDRITHPQIIRDIENMIKERRNSAYGGGVPDGTMDNPLREISSEVKTGYGWLNKTKEMTDLLVKLATHVGHFVIDREAPHRSYSSTGKDKSRRISLTLRAMRNLEVLHAYQFVSNYIDDADVVEIFKKRSYPEIVWRDKPPGTEFVVTHVVAPGGITEAGVKRLREIQRSLDKDYGGKLQLDAMRLDELVWGELYPRIKERYQDPSGKFGTHYLNRDIRKVCHRLCEPFESASKAVQASHIKQLELFNELVAFG
ncbi:MAG: KilA-N domain-containing protein [Okeania sp. SIO2D1]|nr:KilA-N domain-containing protein [Okeania sp. SIO2D1]